MKFKLLFFISVVSLLSCSKDEVEDDLPGGPSGPTGPIDSFITICKRLTFELEYVKTNTVTFQEWTYDSEGRETGYKYYTNGNLDQENINYQHDEKGNA
ncbi:MAG: hypothetical protein RIE58_07075, partial [Vicingaceae bacterium]